MKHRERRVEHTLHMSVTYKYRHILFKSEKKGVLCREYHSQVELVRPICGEYGISVNSLEELPAGTERDFNVKFHPISATK